MRSKISSACCSVLISLFCGASTHADMMFGVTFSAQALTDLSAAEQSLFTDALSFWDAIIVDHRDLASRSWNLNVNTFNQAAMGGGILLGSAGPNGLIFSNAVVGALTSNGRFIISTGGDANFNVNPATGGLSLDTIKHEIGHALGIGTLWEDNEVYNDGTAGNHNRTLAGGTPGQYVGAAGLAAYQAEFVGQSGVSFVPVELGGGPGTANGHWDESDDFGQTLTGVVDLLGRDRKFELMTGWAAPGTDFISNTTIQSLFDIGFIVNSQVTPVPEPSSIAFAAIGSIGFLVRYRRRRRVRQ